MHSSLKTLAAGVVLAVMSGTAMAEDAATPSPFTANIGVTSNYLWRGITQTEDNAAVSGGLDYAHSSGFYVGTWTSSLNGHGNYELDFYGGYKGTAGDFGYDLGVIRYEYPKEGNDTDFTELYLGGSYGIFSAKYSYSDDYAGSKKSAYYIEGAVAYEISKDLILGAHVGVADGNAWSRSLTDYNISLTKGEFSLLVGNTNHNKDVAQSDNARVLVSWKKSFDL